MFYLGGGILLWERLFIVLPAASGFLTLDSRLRDRLRLSAPGAGRFSISIYMVWREPMRAALNRWLPSNGIERAYYDYQIAGDIFCTDSTRCLLLFFVHERSAYFIE